ncbi:MAG: 30S ribosomal protein S12 methylthiotransferase RimO [Lachnospiraceae bacterium]|nr:30S ribosomal protein S12 methylthiotransferase RimO [Lachnospiraceae bacterium]
MKVFFNSLGCDKNLCDAEHMLSLLSAEGLSITDDEGEADVAIINTCCFINDALSESIENIIALGSLKKGGHLKALIVTGCMAERYREEIEKSLPEVDCIVGTSAYDEIVPAVRTALSGEKKAFLKDLSILPDISKGRIRSFPSSSFPLKIAEGCNKHCTYCVIPSMRGPYRSYPIEDLVLEAGKMSLDSSAEVVLVAQETTLYGTDIYEKKALPDLISRLSELENVSRIRIMYAYPEEVTEDILLSIAGNKKVAHYLDIPIQHCSDRILKRMGRKTKKEELIENINMMRSIIPDIALRTTVMCGFPGETEEDHEELLSFISDMKFDHLGAFCYSKEEGTKSATFRGQVKKETKERWLDEVMTLQKDISKELSEKLIGHTYDAIVDGYLPDEDCVIARIYRDAPDIDSYLFIPKEPPLMAGTLVKARIEEANAYDYRGVLLE